MRIKSRWQKGKGPKSIQQQADAVGFIAWQIAANVVLNLENKDYETQSNQQRLDIIAEFTFFFVQCADRLAYTKLDDEQRHTFITALAMKLATTMNENRQEIQGAGDYRTAFIDQLNLRLSDYAECQFDDETPGYSFYRALGNFVQPVMGEKNNRWVADQILDIEGPDAFDTFKKSMKSLFQGSLL